MTSAAIGGSIDPRPGATMRAVHQDVVLMLSAAGPEWRSVADSVIAAGFDLVEVTGVSEALGQLARGAPDVVLVPADIRGLELLDRLRGDDRSSGLPVVVLTFADKPAALFEAFARGADDVVPYSAQRGELTARIQAKLDRRAVARPAMLHDPRTGALSEQSFGLMLRRESDRARLLRRPACLAYLTLHELTDVRAKLGQRAHDLVLAAVVEDVRANVRELDEVGIADGGLALLLPDTSPWAAHALLDRLVDRLHARTFRVDDTIIQLTPSIGFAAVEPGIAPGENEARAWTATLHAAEQLDLQVKAWRPGLTVESRRGRLRRWLDGHRTLLQVTAQQLGCLGVPLLAYWALDRVGLDITSVTYLIVVAALVFTALAIWVECLAAHRPQQPPEAPRGRYPPASAIIAAYLPNEAETIVETVEAFLRQDYNQLQIILAYNTPHDLPVEDELRSIAARDARFVPMRVDWSTSKAQNVNAALTRVTGTFVGVFDADHHPAPGSFLRAWHWLSNGVDVVQGHCVVRNGADGFVQRMVACEFEAIYSVAHPGRARLHGFGIFGGSNGYWRTAKLKETRLRSFMLTEDIDSSMRAISDGGRIVSDPGLVSTELSPENVRALWGQRLRWAQGWAQVSWRYLGKALRNDRLTVRQRVGLLYLLGWREVYPWLSLQIFPILAFWYLRGSPPISWVVPVFLLTTAFTFSAGVVQAWTAWRLAVPDLRRRRRWFVVYGLVSQLLYTEFKNVVARTAHLKELMGERKWKVTPRNAAAARSGDAGKLAADARVAP